MYYELISSPDEDFGITEIPDLPLELSFKSGELITLKVPDPLQFAVDTTASHPPPDFMRNIIPVLSPRMLKLLRAAGVDNLQDFPALLVNPETRDRWTAHRAVNIVGKIDCANLKKSDFAEIGAGLLEFRTIVIDEKKARGALLFRLARSPRRILIHEKVVDYLLDHDEPEVTGYDLDELG